MRVERKETALEVARGKGGGRELEKKGKYEKQDQRKCNCQGKSFQLLSWLQPVWIGHSVYSLHAATHCAPGENGWSSTTGPLAATSSVPEGNKSVKFPSSPQTLFSLLKSQVKSQNWTALSLSLCRRKCDFKETEVRKFYLWGMKNQQPIPSWQRLLSSPPETSQRSCTETYCREMLLTIFIGLLAKTEPCSLMVGWQLIWQRVTHGYWPQGEVTARSGLNLTICTKGLGI